ncbi:MAG: sorting protein [Rhodoferax sp.]|nr:sorting protein [Rhodoferax sp.]
MKIKYVIAGMVATLISAAASAGPFILAGTDADDHGSASGSVNLDGWLFMQKALENIGGSVTNSHKVVTVLGSSGSALSAASSAFNKSTLFSAGWALQTIGVSDFVNFFNSTGAFGSTGVSSAGILMMDSGPNINGGVAGTSYVPYASTINNFVGGGGGLLSQANGYEWLGTLGLNVTVASESDTGISLTVAGNSNCPGLTNADLSAGPYHERFENVGAIPVLGIGTATRSAVIIGGATGSITNPGNGNTVPEPSSIALLGLGLAGLLIARRRKQS